MAFMRVRRLSNSLLRHPLGAPTRLIEQCFIRGPQGGATNEFLDAQRSNHGCASDELEFRDGHVKPEPDGSFIAQARVSAFPGARHGAAMFSRVAIRLNSLGPMSALSQSSCLAGAILALSETEGLARVRWRRRGRI
jgi:hypothetical protein